MEETAFLSLEYLAENEISDWPNNQLIAITSNPFIVGRAQGSHLHLNTPSLSRQHIKIYFKAERYFVIDLESTNGSFLNEERLRAKVPYVLRSNTLIRLGDVAVLRFSDPSMTEVAGEPKPFLLGGVWLDEAMYAVYVERKRLDPPLSANQFQMLGLLMAQPGDVVTRDQIADALWPAALGGVTAQMIDNTASRLRLRLKEADAAHDYIETVRNVGYRFVLRPGQVLPKLERLVAGVGRERAGK